MAFTFSQSSNPNQLFMLEWSAIAGNRWDANYNSPSRLLFYSNLRGKSLKRIRDVIAEGSYGILPPGDSYSTKKPVRLVRATDMKKDLSIDYSSTVFVDQDHYDNNPRCRLQKNDILLAVKGATIASGKCVSFIDTDVSNTIFNGSVFRIRSLPSVRPKFLAYMLDLDLSKNQMKLSLVSNNAVDYLDSNTIRHLLVYLPSESEQYLIVRKLDHAYDSKRRKEDEAQNLLISIDDYLLNILGFILPPDGSNSIRDRMFKRDWSEISGERWDSSANSASFSFNKSHYRNIRFSEAVTINPPTKTSSLTKTNQVSFVPMEAVSDELGIIKNAYTRPFSEKTGYTLFQEGDVVWAKITPCMQNGKSAVAIGLSNGVGFGSTEFHVFRPTPLVRAEFIHAILRLRALRFQAMKWFSGSAGQQRVDLAFFKKLSIPVPPLEIQEEIIHEIEGRRTKAIRLQQEAVDIVKAAKTEVEQLILGG